MAEERVVMAGSVSAIDVFNGQAGSDGPLVGPRLRNGALVGPKL
jgi:hypothetical protein